MDWVGSSAVDRVVAGAVGILALDIFLVVFDVYFLRTRHYLAAKFYPERVRPRAVWLYNHIMRRRGPLMKAIFFNVYQNSKSTFNSTLYDVLVAKYTAKSHQFIHRPHIIQSIQYTTTVIFARLHSPSPSNSNNNNT